MRSILQQLRQLDWVLLALVFVLVIYGLVMLYSLTLNVESPDFATFRDQILFAVIGFAGMITASLIDYRYLRSFAWWLYGFGVLMLLAVLFFGTEIRGVQSWFVIAGVTFQPVEVAKFLLVIFFAKYFSEHTKDILTLRALVVSGAGVAVYMLLVLLQPDLGSAMILLGTYLAMALLVNVRRWHIVLLFSGLAAGAIISWFVVLRDYQKQRIMDVLVPGSSDPLGIGYNVQQAMVAIGSGKLFGRGLGLGPQSQLNFLPEQKTDFVFASIAEEFGLIGAALLIILFTVLLFRLYRIARRSRDDFGLFVAYGVAVVILIQMIMNIGMNVGIFPVAGVPLPFVSAGGSALVSLMIAIGVVQSVVVHQRSMRGDAK